MAMVVFTASAMLALCAFSFFATQSIKRVKVSGRFQSEVQGICSLISAFGPAIALVAAGFQVTHYYISTTMPAGEVLTASASSLPYYFVAFAAFCGGLAAVRGYCSLTVTIKNGSGNDTNLKVRN